MLLYLSTGVILLLMIYNIYNYRKKYKTFNLFKHGNKLSVLSSLFVLVFLFLINILSFCSLG